jgi:hypothetical protein
MRKCTRCRHPFTVSDLAREETRNMEKERRAASLEGVRFLYYRCPKCGRNDIFVDILPVQGEAEDGRRRRRDEMEGVVRQLQADEAEAVVSLGA